MLVIMRAVVLVEGLSDQLALEVVARRRGRDLVAEGILVESMGGATNIGHYLDRYGPLVVGGLYDTAEERFFRRALDRVGLAADDLEERGFFRCAADLEDELIRAVGPSEVERLIEAEGRLASFRKLQQQPAQRGRSRHDQLRRLMGGRSGGKYHYARLMAEAVRLDRIPRPLTALLDHL
jgi:hypothetical protein